MIVNHDERNKQANKRIKHKPKLDIQGYLAQQL